MPSCRDTGDRDALPVQLNGASHDPRVRRKRRPPQILTEDNNEVRARLAVAFSEPWTERRRLLQHGEEVATDERAQDLSRSVAAERRFPLALA